jgi:hypothetical protein
MMTQKHIDLVEDLEQVSAELQRVNYLLTAKPKSLQRQRLQVRQAKLRVAIVGLEALLDIQRVDEKIESQEWPPRDMRGRFIEGRLSDSQHLP